MLTNENSAHSPITGWQRANPFCLVLKVSSGGTQTILNIKSFYDQDSNGKLLSIQRPKPCGPAHAAGVTVLGNQHRSIGLLSEHILPQSLGHILIQPRNLRHSTAQHEHI